MWYYMNILAMAGIVYLLLRLAIARAERVIVNQSESKAREDRLFIRFIMITASFGFILFFMREYKDDIIKTWQTVSEQITEWYHG